MKFFFLYIFGIEYSGEIIVLGEGVCIFFIGDNVIVLVFLGGFVELVLVVEGVCIFFFNNMMYVEVVGFLLNYCIVFYGFEGCGNFRLGEMVFIFGVVGGVGSVVMLVVKIMGVCVIVVVFFVDKRDYCLVNGVDEVVDYMKEDWWVDFKNKVGEGGLDVVYDLVGGDLLEFLF